MFSVIAVASGTASSVVHRRNVNRGAGDVSGSRSTGPFSPAGVVVAGRFTPTDLEEAV